MPRTKKGRLGMPRAKKAKPTTAQDAASSSFKPGRAPAAPAKADPKPAPSASCALTDAACRKRRNAAAAKVKRAARSNRLAELVLLRAHKRIIFQERLYHAKTKYNRRACDREEARGNIERAETFNIKCIEADYCWKDDQLDYQGVLQRQYVQNIALLEAQLEQRDAKIAQLERRVYEHETGIR